VEICINDLVRETFTLLQPIFQQRGLEVATALNESLPPLFGDGVSLQRVLMNRLDNAVDVSRPDGQLKITTLISPATGSLTQNSRSVFG
jgi:signal transduction histidine kinase